MKHKHADVMHHYAEGGEVEVRTSPNHEWTNCPQPIFNQTSEYRVKTGTPNLNSHKKVSLCELESKILDCWNITNDLLLPIDNEVLSRYYSTKFEKLWDVYSKLIKKLYE